MTFPDMRDMARLATEDFSRIESLEQIKPPYPGQGTPNWWALRLRYEEILTKRLRKDRNGEVSPKSEEWECAKWAALGNEDADRRYQKFVPTAHEVLARQRPDWLAASAKFSR